MKSELDDTAASGGIRRGIALKMINYRGLNQGSIYSIHVVRESRLDGKHDEL